MRETRHPGGANRGGVDSESGNFWHSSRAKITFSVKTPHGVNLKMDTTTEAFAGVI